MGRIAKLLSFVRLIRNGAKVSDVKIDPGGSANITGEHFAPPGDDSFPLKSDYIITIKLPRTGNEAIIGYIDPISSAVALEGDKRIYGRDADGVTKNQVWLKNDGSILSSNDNGSVLIKPDGSIKGANVAGSFELQSGGDFVVNGVTIKANGDVIMPNSLLLNGKEIDGHAHSQANDSGGNIEQNTGGNL